MIAVFELTYQEGWDYYFSKMDKSIQQQIWKKIQQLETLQKSSRHLHHGLPFFVIETGQYRICYKETEQNRKIMFAGNHKQYEKWYKTIK